MLKSLFFKPKANTDELLPPPPPFPSMELEEEKPAIAKEETQVSEELFDDLFSELETKPAKEPKSRKGSELEEPEFSDALLDDLFKDALPESKPRKQAKGRKIKGKKTKPEKDILRKLGIETIVPHKGSEEIQFPETLEGFQLDIDSEMKKFKGDDSQELSPDAEKEIMEAIGEAKGNNKTGFLNNIKQKLMATRSKRAETEAKVYDNASQQAAFASDMEKIQGKIGEARTALMDFNLNKAKSLYLEIISTYNGMKPEDKAKVYNDISDLYSERKSAEQLKV